MAKIKHEIIELCAFCENAECLNDNEKMLCQYRGVVTSDFHCGKFRYDPLKREPKPPLVIKGLSKDDLL